jgi:DNA-binding Lrp family transcriptional regulator
MDELDLKLLQAVQDGLKVTPHPYKTLGLGLGLSEEEILMRLKKLVDEGVIRRFAATIGHISLGIVANAMIVWSVPEDNVVSAGEIMASFEEVSHCYERSTHPEWPYNLYTMVHSRNREECYKIAEDISLATGIDNYLILFSEREYKKTSARI